MILLLGGTTEARLLLGKLKEIQVPIIVSTAHEISEDFIEKHHRVRHIIGRLSAEALCSLIKDNNIDIVVDATHPYALEISNNALQACKETGAKYIRIERPPAAAESYEKTRYADSYEGAAATACEIGKVIFLATGSKSAGIFRSKAINKDCKLYIRVLPDENSINKCIEAGFAVDEIITGVGPFSYEDNYRLWRELGADVVVTKDSGIAGGFTEKLNAAKDLGIEVVIISRPESGSECYRNMDDVIREVVKLLEGVFDIESR